MTSAQAEQAKMTSSLTVSLSVRYI